MTNNEIKALALECGFKLNGETDGEPDLKPYVYEFATRVQSELLRDVVKHHNQKRRLFASRWTALDVVIDLQNRRKSLSQ